MRLYFMFGGFCMNGIQERNTVSERSVEELIAEWEGQKTALYRLHERDVAQLVEMNKCISTISMNLHNLMQRIAGHYIPGEAELTIRNRMISCIEAAPATPGLPKGKP
jgi:hypothetical protein